MKLNALSSCLNLLDSTSNILAITHIEPDGDALGSLVALGLACEQKTKTITLTCADPVPEIFDFIPHFQKVRNTVAQDQQWDLIVTVDCGDLRRTGHSKLVTQYAKQRRLINIDHHQKSDLQKVATVHFGSENAAATAELLIELFNAWSITITKDIATCLLTGLYTDTGGFKHTNTSEKILMYAAMLLEKGARLGKITSHLLNNKPISTLKLWGRILKRMKTNRTWSIVASVVTINDLVDCQATLDDLSGAVNLMNTIPSAKIALLLAETPEHNIKASFRTEDSSIDVGKIASLFGGGGHKKASGFTIPGRIAFDGNRWKIVTR